MNDILTLTQGPVLTLFFKVVLLICIGLFVVFTIFLFTYVQSLKKIVAIKDVTGSSLIFLFSILYVVAAISLFFLALVIL